MGTLAVPSAAGQNVSADNSTANSVVTEMIITSGPLEEASTTSTKTGQVETVEAIATTIAPTSTTTPADSNFKLLIWLSVSQCSI